MFTNLVPVLGAQTTSFVRQHVWRLFFDSNTIPSVAIS